MRETSRKYSMQNRYITQKVTQKVTQLFKNHCSVNASSQSGHVNDRYLNWICLKCYSNHSIGSSTPVITIKRFCTDFGVLTPRTKQRGVTPSYQPFRRGVFISYQNFRKMLLCMSFFSLKLSLSRFDLIIFILYYKHTIIRF